MPAGTRATGLDQDPSPAPIERLWRHTRGSRDTACGAPFPFRFARRHLGRSVRTSRRDRYQLRSPDSFRRRGRSEKTKARRIAPESLFDGRQRPQTAFAQSCRGDFAASPMMALNLPTYLAPIAVRVPKKIRRSCGSTFRLTKPSSPRRSSVLVIAGFETFRFAA